MRSLSLYEFGYVSAIKNSQAYIKQVPDSVFNYLESICLNQDGKTVFLRLKSINGVKAIQFLNYAGVIMTPDGFQIEVLPKVAKHSNEPDKARKSLLLMLKTLGQFRHISTHSADLAKADMPLFEVFIADFLQSVNRLIKQGLHRDYISQQENINAFKGKLLVKKQLQHNLVNKHKFYVEYDEYLHNRPINRLIATALKKVMGYCQNHDNQKLARELSFALVDIPLSRNIKQDFQKVKFSRGMSNYERPLDWAKLILNGFSPVTLKGSNNALSLLFPMEAVFESYTAYILAKTVKSPVVMTSQVSSVSLVNHQNKGYFRLKPDLVLSKNKVIVSVLDSKWKLLDQSKNNGTDKYGLSQADFYQMFAYGHKYMNGTGEMFLIYPRHENFTLPIEHSFDYHQEDEKSLKLFVMPICIDESTPDNERLMWPKNAYTKIN
jgi:5-methylcytosine-specific restriction enzyme subunit McrC